MYKRQGLATAKAFAEAGAVVVLADIHEDAVRSVAEELVSAGHKAIAVRCNVAVEAEVAAMIEQTVVTFGRLDAAFNNAGVQSLPVETADASGEEFDRVNAINLRGVWNCMKHELRQMREQGSGAIVNNSSVDGKRAFPWDPVYSAAKHGVLGLTRTAAHDNGPLAIRVNAIAPGSFITNIGCGVLHDPAVQAVWAEKIPLGAMGRTEQMKPLALYLASDASSWITGAIIPMDGGNLAMNAGGSVGGEVFQE